MYGELTGRATVLARDTQVTAEGKSYRRLADLDRYERTLRERRDALAAETMAEGTVSAAGAWLLDNHSYIQSQVRELREAMPRGYYRRLPRLTAGELAGDPRVYGLAVDIVRATGGDFDIDAVRAFCQAYQQEAVLTLAEVWAVGPMLKLALIGTLAEAGDDEATVRAAVRTLRRLEAAGWRDFVESISAVERILREDPAGVHARMDFETRDAYRHTVEGIARGSGKEETAVAALAVEMARENRGHIGYYLAGDGQQEFKRRAGFRGHFKPNLRGMMLRYPDVAYFGALAGVTAAILYLVFRMLAPVPWWTMLLVALPASQAALAVVNPLLSRLVPPRRLPRMDFSEGIPNDCRTFVVVPTLLLSRTGLERLLENLEIHYLANRDPNLLFALLTDFPDASEPAGPKDHLLDECVEGIRRLNDRYRSEARGPFYLFHRGRQWNASEGVWMGHERKRGKLNDFNLFLLGEADRFEVKEGDLDAIGRVRYVLTLDSDTQLPRDTALKLVGNMAHPLNRPVFDRHTGIVRKGYALMQPRISISMESAGRSHLARIFSGQTGFDPYTTAVSDVYQDLYARASFTGKGIYDLRAFHRATDGRFPDNTLLSHDLIEGEHVRTGLVTDQEFIDDYPSSYEAYSKRKHRWVRGDWQIAMWLLPRVPDAEWRWVKNPLPLVSRWKILDNLRRSLVEISLVVLLLSGWSWLPGSALAWTLAAVGLLALPAYAELVLALLRPPHPRFWRAWGRDVGFRFVQSHFEATFHLVFLGHQACSMADAVVRTLVRRLWTHRRLLEWESAAQAEASAGAGISLMTLYLYGSPAVALVAVMAAQMSKSADVAALVLIEAWIFAPLAARWVDRALPKRRNVPAENKAFLRDVALETWHYFADYCRAEDNWLVPDNVQEDPHAEAHCCSPTNLGLLLTANLAAHDFGYLTPQEMAERTERTLRTMSRMERCRGHYYNWYDTRTLLPILPQYVSSVDSGNLAASLVVLKQGCLERLKRPLIERSTLEGLRDYCLRLRNALPAEEQTSAVVRLTTALVQQLEYRPTDLFYWEGVLSETAKLVGRLCKQAESPAARLEANGAPEAAEVRYWAGALATRITAVLHDLYALAPWVDEPFEMELRMRSADPTIGKLLDELYRVPLLGEMPARYDVIAERIRERLQAPEPLPEALARTLEDLLEALPAARRRAVRLIEHFEEQAAVAAGFIEEMDFEYLFDSKRKLLRIGHDAGTDQPDEGYYDLLASEARTAVFLAIAKGDLPREAWFRLGRKLTAWRGHRTLLSWSGTMFEYLMPAIFMETHEETLLGQSARAVVRIQQAYGREHNVPWGISESAHSARDSALRYQYHAFGIPALGLKRRTSEDLVTAPYASALALMVDCGAATENLREIAARGWRGRYGLYEAVDHTPRGPVLVRSYMAHHQGMSLAALANVLLDAPMRRRFHAEPMVQATEFLLQERLASLLKIAPEEDELPAAAPLVRRQLETAP
ncbi:MAG TPA: glucoamylase family protein [Bryobacteraceae bacterium]|nr:glucoamylase family protein [Bryobacteraceae bacterium]